MIDDGGPVFAQPAEIAGRGISLRDHYAGIALPKVMEILASEGGLTQHGAAESAFKFADAMLKARKA